MSRSILVQNASTDVILIPLSREKNLRSSLKATPRQEKPEMFRFAQHDNAI
jgi:hypothetical protein